MKNFRETPQGTAPPTSDDAAMPAESLHDEKIAQEVAELRQRLRRIEDRLIFKSRTAEQADKGTQLLLAHKYRELAEKGQRLSFEEVAFSNYSQFEEDGILLYIFSSIGAETKRAVEICAGNGFEANTTNLILNHSWNALLVDGNADKVQQGIDFFARHPATRFAGPTFLSRWIDRETINDLLEDSGFTGEIDLLVLDLDGVDYWIWEAITAINPKVVCVEVMTHLGERSITVPYSADFQARWIPMEDEATTTGADNSRKSPLYHQAQYAGASLPAFTKLAEAKGYRLIGGTIIGSNVFYMRNDIGEQLFPKIDWHECVNTAYDVKLREMMNAALADQEWVEV